MHKLSPSTSTYRAEIDGLRAFAVLSVLVFHAFPNLLRGGFIGVDIFFVISGFLITSHIFEKMDVGTFSFLDFFERRVRRIFPALSIVLISSLAFGWFVLFSDEYAQLGKHIASGGAFIINFVLVGESGYFDNAAETKPMLHLWSLAVEEQFYIMWPIALWVAWKRKFSYFVLIIMLASVSLLLNLAFIETKPTETFFWSLGRFWELLCGGILAWLRLYRYEKMKSLRDFGDKILLRIFFNKSAVSDGVVIANLLSIIGVALLIYGVFEISPTLSFPGYWALIPVFGALFIIAGGRLSRVNQLLLMNPISIWFGLISYPLYLWHWPVLSFLQIIEGEVPNANVKIYAVIFSIILAWVTYRFIERPIRERHKKAPRPFHLFMSVLVISLIGLYVFQNDGIADRKSIKVYSANLDELKRTAATESACESFLGLDDLKFNYCRISELRENGVVAVVGDSHAHVAFPGIAEGLKEYGQTVILLANSGCPPFYGSPSGRNDQERMDCAERIEQILQSLYAIKDLKLVLFLSRGPIYWTGKEPARNYTKKPTLSFESYFIGMQRTVDQLSSLGAKVVYITENPELIYNARSCLPRPLNDHVSNRCNQKLENVLARQSDYLTFLDGLSKIQILDSKTAFCNAAQGYCFSVDEENQLLYADDDHISVIGSRRQFSKVIGPYLKKHNVFNN